MCHKYEKVMYLNYCYYYNLPTSLAHRQEECGISGVPLDEVVDHGTSPIRGLSFLSQSQQGRQASEDMKKFASKARTDILDGKLPALYSNAKILGLLRGSSTLLRN